MPVRRSNSQPSEGPKSSPTLMASTCHGSDSLSVTIQRACLIAMDAAFNIGDLIGSSSMWAFQILRECEKELDQIERDVDEQMPQAITQVNESRARELLACVRFIGDLERIGDLLLGAGKSIRESPTRLPKHDAEPLKNMAKLLRDMLERIYQGFQERELQYVDLVLKMDSDMDRICHRVIRRQLTNSAQDNRRSIDVLFIAHALERAGDHATNLAEELYRLIEGHTLRHVPPRQRRTALGG